MMISSRGRYALRVMLDLAQRSSGGYLSLRDIAERQEISRKYLESIMAELCRQGLVESAMGKAGGYRLSHPPEAISAGAVLRAAEGGLPLVACLSEECKKCESGGGCHTYFFWKGLEAEIDRYVNRYTLRDLLDAAEQTPDLCGPERKLEDTEA